MTTPTPPTEPVKSKMKKTIRPIEERLESLSMPIPESGCRVWMAYCNSNGYGRIHIDGRNVMAHRVSWELVNGPIPAGLRLDHLCRVRPCINPAHLEVVTNRVNVLIGVGFPAVNAKKTHCPKGHRYSGSNLIIEPNGRRKCRICVRALWHKRKHKYGYKGIGKS